MTIFGFLDTLTSFATICYGVLRTQYPWVCGVSVAAFSWFDGVAHFVKFILAKMVATAASISSNFPTYLGFISDLLQTINDFTFEYYPKVNAYVPLDMIFVCVSFYILLLLASVVWRTVKAYVPTVS